jgi:hypothetical protein
MVTKTENLILEHLKLFQAAQSRLDRRLEEAILRLGHLEGGVAQVQRSLAHLEEGCALLSVRMDKLVERVARIERRLELA